MSILLEFIYTCQPVYSQFKTTSIHQKYSPVAVLSTTHTFCLFFLLVSGGACLRRLFFLYCSYIFLYSYHVLPFCFNGNFTLLYYSLLPYYCRTTAILLPYDYRIFFTVNCVINNINSYNCCNFFFMTSSPLRLVKRDGWEMVVCHSKNRPFVWSFHIYIYIYFHYF